MDTVKCKSCGGTGQIVLGELKIGELMRWHRDGMREALIIMKEIPVLVHFLTDAQKDKIWQALADDAAIDTNPATL